jgi:hypothetical protein
MVAIVSVISLYIYEHPHHHCPFCILKSGHDFIGYFLYLPLFAGTLAAIGVGVSSTCARTTSLTTVASAYGVRFAWCSLGLFGVFYALVIFVILRSNLTMAGVWW